MLHAIGEDVSIFDAMALLIAMFTLGQLPIGPSIGPAAAVLILGSHGVASQRCCWCTACRERHRPVRSVTRPGRSPIGSSPADAALVKRPW